MSQPISVDLVAVLTFKPELLSFYPEVWKNINNPDWLKLQPVEYQNKILPCLKKNFFAVPKRFNDRSYNNGTLFDYFRSKYNIKLSQEFQLSFFYTFFSHRPPFLPHFALFNESFSNDKLKRTCLGPIRSLFSFSTAPNEKKK